MMKSKGKSDLPVCLSVYRHCVCRRKSARLKVQGGFVDSGRCHYCHRAMKVKGGFARG
jgi:hypothetical protein